MANGSIRLDADFSPVTREIKKTIEHFNGLDKGLSSASNSVNGLIDDFKKAGSSMTTMDNKSVALAGALGKIDTSAKNPRKSLSELKKILEETTVSYNKLTDQEKASPFGKALKSSIDQLTERAKTLKRDLGEVNKSLTDTNSSAKSSGSTLDELTSKFGFNIKSLTAWAAAIGASKIALDVMKDAFFASEANLDDWSRAVYSCESAWDAFLTSLNTGDVSGYLSRIDDIVNAAKEAYNELDRLSTQKAINNPAIKAQEAENDRFRAMLRTGRYIAPNDGRKGAMKEGQVLTDAQKKRIAEQLENGMKSLNGYVRSEIDQTTKSINALYKQQAKGLGMTEKEFRSGTANMTAFDERMAGYAKYDQWEYERRRWELRARTGNSTAEEDRKYRGANPYQQYKAWGVFKDDGKLYGQINDLINQRAALQTQNYGNTANAYRAINRATSTTGSHTTHSTATKAELTEEQKNAKEVEKLSQEYIKATDERKAAIRSEIKTLQERNDEIKRLKDEAQGKGKEEKIEVAIGLSGATNEAVDWWIADVKGRLSKAEIGSDLYKSLSANFTDATTFKNILEQWVKAGLDASQFPSDELWEKILNTDGDAVPNDVWQSLVDEINIKLATLDIQPIKIDFTTGKIDKVKEDSKVITTEWNAAGNAISAVGNALNQIEDPAAKVMGTIAQAIATVALSYSQALSSAATAGPWAWLAFAATGAATMMSSISAIRSATSAGSFAEGGVIGGRNYTDQITARVSSGEMVINEADQKRLYDNIHSGNFGGGASAQPHVTGEMIYLGMNNFLKRTGKGEIVTSRR